MGTEQLYSGICSGVKAKFTIISTDHIGRTKADTVVQSQNMVAICNLVLALQ